LLKVVQNILIPKLRHIQKNVYQWYQPPVVSGSCNDMIYKIYLFSKIRCH